MSGMAGFLGAHLPLLVLALASFGPLRGRKLWTLSLALQAVSFFCFLVLVSRFYTGNSGASFSIMSPVILKESQWAPAISFKWTFPFAALSLAACSVCLSFHFIARRLLEGSRASVAGLAGYLWCLLGGLGSDHLLLFSLFLAGSMVPRLVFHGLDTKESRIEAVKETAFLTLMGVLALLVCVLAFSEPFRGSLGSWFRIDGGERIVLPGAIGISLLLLASAICSGLFPFHGNVRRIFQLGELERAVPLALQPVLGFTALFRFAPAIFPLELHAFGSAILAFFSVGIFYCALGFLGSKLARDRIFWLQQVLSCFVAVGFFSLTVKGWHGASVLLFFEVMVVPLFLFVLACHERRPALASIMEIGRYPAFALSTALAALFALFLPVTVGFYGTLLVVWSLVEAYRWLLPFLMFSLPLVALAGVRIMYFRLGERSDPPRADLEFCDLRRDEILAIFPIGLVLLFLGLFPRVLMSPIGHSVAEALRLVVWK